jgi:hypothetical protein
VVLAKKGAWQQFGEMMTVIASREDLTQDAFNLRNIERALYLYSLSHSADEMLQSAVRLTGQLRIPITQRMTTIVLQSFVYNERLDLIRRWLNHADTLVGQARLDEKTVGTLVTTFYLKHRPPHALFLSMTYRFLLQTDYQDHQPFIDTAMESIGYDLRHNTANPSHMPVVLQLAAGNLQLMMSANGTFPRPLQIHHIEQQRERSRLGAGLVALRMPEREQGVLVADPEVGTNQENELSGLQASLQKHSRPKSRGPKGDRRLLASNHAVEGELGDELSGVEASLEKRSTVEVVEPERDLGTLASGQEAFDSVDTLSGVRDPSEMQPADDDAFKTSLGFGDLREEQHHEDIRSMTKVDRTTASWDVPDDLPLRPRKLEREMVFALSRRDYHQVLELYRSSLGSGGMPASFRTLELAVEASLQASPGLLDGAQKLLAEANAAGMNTDAARGSLLIREMNNFSPEEKKSARVLSWKVLEFHRANKNSGLRIGRVVGVHAANVLINNHCAQEGLRLLRSLHTPGDNLYHPDDSVYAATKPTFNIVTLTVFIKAFVSLGQANGIRWAVAYIMQHNIRVDIAILDSLRNHVKTLSKQYQYGRTALPPRTRLALAKYLRNARLVLSARRSQQLRESAHFGKKLLRCLRTWRYAMLEKDAVRTSLFEPLAADENSHRAQPRRSRAVSQPQNPRISRERIRSTSQSFPFMTTGRECDEGDLQHDALSHLMSPVAASG